MLCNIIAVISDRYSIHNVKFSMMVTNVCPNIPVSHIFDEYGILQYILSIIAFDCLFSVLTY